MLPMLNAWHDLPLCRTIAGKLVGDHDARRPALLFQQLPEQAFGGPFVPPALHQDVEHDAVLVHRAPQPVLLASDLEDDLIQMPFVSGRRQPPPDPVGEVLAELARPLSYALVADDDAARGQHLLDHAQAEREAKVEPDGVANDLGREAVAGIAGANGRRHPVWLPALLPIRKPASSQVDGAMAETVTSVFGGHILADRLRSLSGHLAFAAGTAL